MDILGIGFPELIVILIIAMMIFGPRRLPEIAAKAGKIVRDLRGMSQGLLLEWQREITVAARLEELQEARKELELAKQEFDQAQQEIGRQTKKEIEAAEIPFEERTIAPNSYLEHTSPETPKTAGNAAPDSRPFQNDMSPETLSEQESSDTASPSAEIESVADLKAEPEAAESNGKSSISSDGKSPTLSSSNVSSSSVPRAKPKEALE